MIIQREKKARHIAVLLAGYMRDTLTPAEHDLLDEWVGASDKNMRLFEELTDEGRVKLALEILNSSNDNIESLAILEESDYPVHINWKMILNALAIAYLLGWAIVGMIHVLKEL